MKATFRVEGLDCANCAAKIEREVAALAGVKSASLNFMTTKLTIEGDDADMPRIISEAGKIVSRVEPGASLQKA